MMPSGEAVDQGGWRWGVSMIIFTIARKSRHMGDEHLDHRADIDRS